MKKLAALIAVMLAPGVVQAAQTLQEVISNPPKIISNSAIPEVRYAGLRDTAMAYGAQAGLAYQNEINLSQVLKRSDYLDQIYNFGALMIDGVIVPPVLIRAENAYDQSSPNTIRLIGESFNIEEQARFSYVAPDWRTYLVKNYVAPSKSALMPPANDAEVALWKQFVQEGFEEGQRQANVILQENYARLNRDFNGMALALKLMIEEKITRPFVASNTTDVTGNPDEVMNVNDTVLRITANPRFNMEKKTWKK